MSWNKGGWYGVDLDGTLARYESGDGIESIGEPIPEMVKFVKELLADGCEVRILTARVCSLQTFKEVRRQEGMIKNWCEKHLGVRLEVTAEKDYEMITLYDDRAVQVVTNKGILVG